MVLHFVDEDAPDMMIGKKGTNVNLDQFAKCQRSRLRRDPEDHTMIIPATRGKSHVFEYAEGVPGVLVMCETDTSRWWTQARAAFIAAGMQITQNGAREGFATFDPENPAQVRVALKYPGVRRRRKVTRRQKVALAKGRANRTSKISAVPPGQE